MERFDHYMERCLYGPDGFYSSGTGSAGRRGDFITSPEVGPLFGVLLGRWLDQVWEAAGRPDPFVVIDAGTGPGTLLRGLAMAEPACAEAWQLTGVDRAVADVRIDGDIRIQPELPADLANSVIIANELLDNLPFRIVRRSDGGFVESFVSDGAFVDQALDEATVPAAAALGLRGGDSAGQVSESVPLLHDAAQWVRDVLAQKPLRLLALDYGDASTAALAARGGWLRTYRSHAKGSDPLIEPGLWDITTDIAVDQLPGSPAVVSQAAFLHQLGIDELVREGREVWEERAARPDMEAFRMRSRISESEALIDPTGLGSWLVLEWAP